MVNEKLDSCDDQRFSVIEQHESSPIVKRALHGYSGFERAVLDFYDTEYRMEFRRHGVTHHYDVRVALKRSSCG